MTAATARAYEKLMGLPVLNFPITAAHAGAPVHQRPGGWPVVLYSHSLGGKRWESTCLAEDQLAVINRGGNPDHEHQLLPRGLRGALDLRRTGMFGFSDGGSTTAHALHTDARLTAGVNLDGTLWTPQAVAGSGRPLLLFGEASLDPYQAKTYAEFWTRQRGPKLWLNLRGSKHQTFTDFAALLPQAAPILHKPPSWVIQGIGAIGPRAVAVERAYIGAWFDRYLRHRDSDLLRGPSPYYPEVVFTRR